MKRTQEEIIRAGEAFTPTFASMGLVDADLGGGAELYTQYLAAREQLAAVRRGYVPLGQVTK